jgi:hypothetical protein
MGRKRREQADEKVQLFVFAGLEEQLNSRMQGLYGAHYLV